MDEKIIDFAQLLRQNGIRISTPDVMDAVRALECIPLSDRTIFQQALCSSLIKEAGQIKIFDYLFESYFLGLPRLLASQADKNLLPVFTDPGQIQELLDRLREILEELEMKLSPLAEALVFRDVGRLTLMIQEAARPLLEADFQQLHQSYQFAFQTMARMDFGSVQKEILELIKQIQARLAEYPGAEPLPEYLQNLLKEFPQLLKEFFLQEYQKKAYALRKGIRQERIYQMNFFTSTPAEIQDMSKVARELAEKLKAASSLRREIKSQGRLQVRATLRKNLRHGGIPFQLVFEKKKIAKPQIVILTDISNSMRNASRFMLTLVYSLQELYSRVRSFLFVSDIGEATGLFQQYEIGEAINRSLTGSVIGVWEMTDYGHALKKFHQQHLAAVDSKTIFIVLGDARCNYQSPQDWVLAEIQRRARMVIWLNPEAPSSCGAGDSEMNKYLPYCDLVRQVSNLKQLSQVAEELVAI